MEIRDFKCGYGNSVGISSEVTQGLGLSFPDAYTHADTMITLARAIKEHDNAGFCILPFCRTVEAEAMGGIINLGDENTGPRAKDYITSDIRELLELPDIDFGSGRIHEVLEACRIMHEEGETVALEVTGPFTILNGMIDARYVFKAMRKDPDTLFAVTERIGMQLLRYVSEAKKAGVDIIIYSDSAGALNILGPKMLAQAVEGFTYIFACNLADLADENMIVLLCPKFAYALIDTGHAEYVEHDLGRRISFLDALLEMKGRAALAGQVCIKLPGATLANGIFREVKLIRD